MEPIIRAFGALVWFVYQAVIVGGLGAAYFIVPFAILAAVLAVTFSRMDPTARARLGGLLLSLPASWVFVGLWGGFFWVDLGARPVIRNPAWVEYPLDAIPLLFVVIVGVFTWRLRGARLFTLTYSLINMYFLLAIVFLSGMAVTGTWL